MYPNFNAEELLLKESHAKKISFLFLHIRLSGNPPFYDETDDDDYENHDKNLFRKILAGDYEFDSPYWDDISESGTVRFNEHFEGDTE